MGFSLKSITKGITKAADVAFNPSTWVSTAKDVFSNDSYGGIAKTGLEALGTYFGYPGLGSAVGGLLGGSGNMSDVLSAGLSGYSAQQLSRQNREEQLGDYQRAYDDQLRLLDKQNTNAREMADRATLSARESASLANVWSRQNMEYANQMNQSNAREEMAWQQGMSSTAHQREVQDLRAAGLNPLLSGTGGMGASSSGGASGSVGAPAGPNAGAFMPQVAQMGNVVSSAFDAMKAMASATQMNAATSFQQGPQTALTRAQTETTGKQGELAGAQRVKTMYEAANQLAQNPKIHQEVANLKAIHANYLKTGHLTDAQTEQVKQSTRNMSEIYKDLRMKGKISDSELGTMLEIGKRTTDVTGNLNSIMRLFKK